MSNMNGRSVPMNQTLKLPGGVVLTRAEMHELIAKKGIRVDLNYRGATNPRGWHCDVHCDECIHECTPHNASLFNGLYDEEVRALIQADVISLTALNTEQLHAIRSTAQETLERIPSLEKQLSPERLKAIKG